MQRGNCVFLRRFINMVNELFRRVALSLAKRDHTPSPTYQVWRNMIYRCYNPNNKSFKNYGGRGIKVCDEWRFSFQTFLHDMGERPPRLTLDRINNDGNYTPGNCRWATYKEQNNNNRPSSNKWRLRIKNGYFV